MNICSFIESHMELAIVISTALQVIGSFLLALFSFFGLEFKSRPALSINGEPVVHVTDVSVRPRWVTAAKTGLVLLTVGILLSGVESLVSAQSGIQRDELASGGSSH